MTLIKTQALLQRYLKRIQARYRKNDSGAVAVEFVITSLVFIPFFLGTLDYTNISIVKKTTKEVGSSVLRAVSHVPEYDGRMRRALEVLCGVHSNTLDKMYIEILSITFNGTSLNSHNRDWEHLPCETGAPPSPLTAKEINAEFANLNLRNGESLIVVKTSYVAQSLADAKYIYGPSDYTYTYFNAATPRIANTVLYTDEELYDVTTYEY